MLKREGEGVVRGARGGGAVFFFFFIRKHRRTLHDALGSIQLRAKCTSYPAQELPAPTFTCTLSVNIS